METESIPNRGCSIKPRCEGKVAVVTGAAGDGVGRSIALTLAREGASVVVNYRSSRTQAKEIVEQIKRSGGAAIAIQADIFKEQECKDLINQTNDQFNTVDICIINPGGGWHPEPVDQLDVQGTLEDLHHEIDPLVYLLPLVLPGMYARNWGRVIGIAMHPTKLSPAYAYNLGKAARQQAFLLASEQAWTHGVTMNILAPGPVSAIETLGEAVDQSKLGAPWDSRSNVSPQDIAEGAAFFCSEAGRFITGCVMPYVFYG